MLLKLDSIIEDNGSVIPVTRPVFSTIAKMLKSLPSRGVGVIWGVNVIEEMNHYALGLGLRHTPSTIMNGQNYSVQQEAAIKSGQYARRRYKVESFLWRPVPSAITLRVNQETTLEFADIFDFAAAATWQQLVQYIKPRYAATRRVKDGIEDDIQTYLMPFRSAPIQGDIVTRWRGVQPSFEDLILLWMFYHTPHVARIVITVDSRQKWIDSSSVIVSTERDFISIDELVESAAAFLKRSPKSVNEVFGLWKRGVAPNVRPIIKKGSITEGSADAFLRAYAPIVADDDAPNLGIIVPGQQPAPLRFKTSNDRIDIVDDKEVQSNEARITGSARACVAALDDMGSYTGFDNAVPTFKAKIARVKALITDLCDGTYDDNTVVQLGVEVEIFESRIAGASEMISDMALAESASFFPQVQGLLHQFSIWSAYKAKVSDQNVSLDASLSAADVLNSTRLRNDVLTGRAKDRVEDYVTGIEPQSNFGESSAVIVVENMAAQAASVIAKFSHDTGVPVSPALAKSITKSKTDGPAQWLIENSGELGTFADTGKVSWLKTFLGALGRKD